MIARALAYAIAICGIPIFIFGGLAIIVHFRGAKERQRQRYIAQQVDRWGETLCRTLLQGKIDLNMTEEMVILAWGNPTEKEFKQKTRNGERYRWKYKNPQGRSAYVWVTDGIVNKIEM